MEWSQFLDFMREGDGGDVKYLGSIDSEDDLGPILVAMANTRGGTIVLGFDKRNYHLLGTELDDKSVFNLTEKLCCPTPLCSVDSCEKNDKQILIINVKESPAKPYYYRQKCYVLNPGQSPLSVLEKDVLKDDRTIAFLHEKQADYKYDDDNSTENTSDSLYDMDSITAELLDLHDNQAQNLELLDDSKEDISHSFQDETQLSINTSQERPLNDRQKMALAYINEHKMIKNKLYRSLYSVSHKTAHIELVDLVGRGLIVSQGSGRSTCYVIDESCLSLDRVLAHQA
jgi:predicted HTH transcriptional regulator